MKNAMAIGLLLGLAVIAAEPGWFEAEDCAPTKGQVTLLDENASDYGQMARGAASGGKFCRMMPGTVLSHPPRTLPEGSYAIWIRVFAIDSRLTEVRIDDQAVGVSKRGPNRPGLVWQRLGTVELKAGEHRVSLAAAAGNTKLAYVDVLWLTPDQRVIPTGRTPSEALFAQDQSPSFQTGFDDAAVGKPIPAPWLQLVQGDQWTRIVKESGRQCLRLHNGTGRYLTVYPKLAFTPDKCRQIKVSFTARRYGITETIAVDLAGIGNWQPMLRRGWTTYEQVFLIPPNLSSPIIARLVSRGAGDVLVDDLKIGPPSPPIDPFETGRFLPEARLGREGRLFELERYVTNPALFGDEDRDGDGRWSLVRLDRDHNTPMFSRGTALKSDSDPASSPALEFELTDLVPGPYCAWACATGRPVEWQLADGETVRGDGEAQSSLGKVVVPPSGRVKLRARQLSPVPGNPGPAYIDYVTLIPTENKAFTELPPPTHPQATKEAVERAEVTFQLRRPGVAAGGLALPHGALLKPDHCRVLSAGQPVPTVARSLCRWPDGSIKWLLVRAGPLPAGEGVLEYGNAVRPPEIVDPMWMPVVRRGEDSKGLFWGSFMASGLDLGSLAGELVLEDGTRLRPTVEKGKRETDGAIYHQHRITGYYANGDRRPFGFELLATWGREDKTLLLEHTLIATGPARQERIRSLRLIANVKGGPVRCPELAGKSATRARLVQDAGNPWGEPIEATYQLGADGQDLAGKRAAGVIQSGNWHLAVDDFVEQYPMALSADAQSLTLEIWPEDAKQGAFVANLGMAKTHCFRIGLGEPVLPIVDWLRFDPAALRKSGALGPLTAAGPATKAYDDLLDPAFEDVVRKRGGFGMENWGDVFQHGYVRGVKTWSNQEWDLAQSWLVAYARTGKIDYLDYVDAAARHFADVDCIHAGAADAVGAARTHCHTSLIGHQLEGPNLAHSGWVEGLLNHYYLTGCERSQRAAVAIGNWTARRCFGQDMWSPSGPPYRLPQNRQAGWPLTTLCLVYQETHDPALLVAARRLVDYMHRCQMPQRGCWESMAPHERPWRGGCVFCFTNFRGLKLYGEITGEKTPDEDRRRAGQWLLGELWRPGDRYLYEQCPTHEPGTNVGFLQWGTLADLTELTDNPLYLLVALDGLDLRLQNPKRLVLDMARAQWGNGTIQQGASMLATAAQRLPTRPHDVAFAPARDKIEIKPGGTKIIHFQLENKSDQTLTDLRLWPLIRGDWKATITNQPTSVPPGKTVDIACEVSAPSALHLAERDNDTAYCHLAIAFRQDGRKVAMRAFCRLGARK